MSGKEERDIAGRALQSRYHRKKRARTAAQHRWKHKWKLEPGEPRSWSERCLANKLKHRAAAAKGGQTTGRQIREQQRLYWRWYHGNCKAGLSGPFRVFIETLERIEAAFIQRYGRDGFWDIRWDAFEHGLFCSYILLPCWKQDPEAIEREMWAQYHALIEADETALYGNGETPGLLQPLLDHTAEMRRRQEWKATLRALAELRRRGDEDEPE